MINIYVMDRGFVLVGRPQPREREDYLFTVLNDCAVIRNWGTEKGLGQLAMRGPTSSSRFDEEPDGTKINRAYLLREIPCNEEAWKSWPKR